jgi:hypothetical protein
MAPTFLDFGTDWDSGNKFTPYTSDPWKVVLVDNGEGSVWSQGGCGRSDDIRLVFVVILIPSLWLCLIKFMFELP